VSINSNKEDNLSVVAPKVAAGKVMIEIETLENSIHQTMVMPSLTILELKNLIRTTISDSLEPKSMTLTY